jgi:hypothetical protein
MYRLIFKITCIFLLLAFQMCTNNPESPNVGSIEGNVTNATGDTVIVGAIITTTPPTSSVSTDAQGRYSISEVQPGQYTILASKGGFNPGSVSISVNSGLSTTANIHLNFIAGNTTPNTPTIITPEDGATDQSTSIKLKWACHDPDGDSLTYDLYFGKNNPPAISSSDLTGTSYLKYFLDTSTTYYWKVVAIDTKGASTAAQSAIWSFKTGNKSAIPTDFIVSYQLDDTTESRGVYNLSNINGVSFSSGKYGKCADFGNANTNKSLYNSNNLGICGGNITMSLWVKLSAEVSSGNPSIPYSYQYYFIRQAGGSPSYVGYLICYEYNNGNRRLLFGRQREGIGGPYTYYNIALGTSDWYHLCLTSDGTNVTGYVNGNSIGSNQNPGNGSTDGYLTCFTLGAWQESYPNKPNSSFLNGCIDNVKIYNRVLTAEEVKALYNE